MQKSCRQCAQQFEITDEDLKFYEKISPSYNDKKYQVPPPTLCPQCRQQKRLSFRNERTLYSGKCDLCSKEIVSAFSSDKPHTVYCSPCWWSDKWDATSYGQEFNFNKPFFEQFEELMLKVPHLALTSDVQAVENNCSYINYAGNSKNCYMVFDSDFNEDSYYSDVLKHSKDCIDCSYTQKSEKCYDCIDCENCYNVYYSQDCTTCTDSYFLKNCKGCSNCILCTNLTRKEYHILNKPYSKEEYFKFLKEMELEKSTSVEKFMRKFDEHVQKNPHKYRHSLNTENCSGDYIFNAKNCHECYNVSEAQDLKYCDSLFRAKDCYDVSSFGEKIEMVYESGTIGIDCYDIQFCNIIVPSSSGLRYCLSARSSKNCFGSISIHKGENLILNKKYSKEEYEKMVGRIIEHMMKTKEWGEFFPFHISPFAYNETVAQEYFPLTKEKAEKLRAKWKEYDKKERQQDTRVNIPDNIEEVTDDIAKEIFSCEGCGKNYKLIKQELDFYKLNSVPAPKKCADCRHNARIAKRNPRRLWERVCGKCNAPIRTTYSPKRSETVYCEKCYLETVY